MSIYTRTGDTGTTSLVDGARVSKSDLRLEAYGTIDELTAHIAYLRDMYLPHDAQLEWIIERLMTTSALLATQDPDALKMPRITGEDISQLETWIDEIVAIVPKIKYFTIPGGSPAISYTHICRTVCRRGERAAIACDVEGQSLPIDTFTLKFLNRLSDYLYALGRFLHHTSGTVEQIWVPRL